jgi:hypothetical protein
MRGGFGRCEEQDELERLPGQEHKQMPQGTTWVFVHQLPIDTTDAELQEFLAGIGIPLPLENICASPQRNRMCNAVIGIPSSTVSMLLNWAINNALFRGKSVVEVHEPRPKGAR